jgi:hypothetical protein
VIMAIRQPRMKTMVPMSAGIEIYTEMQLRQQFSQAPDET